MTRQERADLRRRIRAGRDELRRRLREEIGRVDFRALRAQVRSAKAARPGRDVPRLTDEQLREARRRLGDLPEETP